MSSDRLVPRGRLSRLAHLAAAGTRLGTRKLRGSNESLSAADTARVLGDLRGLAAKFGQMAGYVDGVLPAAQRSTYGEALASLFQHAAPSPREHIESLVRSELGAYAHELFASFGEQPVASASIGQVHRARLHDGTDVAVKVQHPGIRNALQSDLANLGWLESLFGSYLGAGFNAHGVVEEFRERFLEELDYRKEATHQQKFHELFRDDPQILIPEVIFDRSSSRVLTTRWAQGLTLDEASLFPLKERKAWTETLWRFVFRSSLVGGLFNADPHPGNFFFQKDGVVTFIDFGCVQPFPQEQLAHALRAHEAAIHRNEKAFHDAGALMLNVQAGLHADLALSFMRQCFEPLFASPFRMTSSFVSDLVQQLQQSAFRARRMTTKQINPLPRGILFLNRLQFGFYSVLARLDAEVDYAAIERPILKEAMADPLLNPGAETR
ncbi:MAG TPA: AarF/ABC1/UbiB kinase family protein [Polyangiaceae bacterium]|nr:AarF/ABC1/UbiB kinase family protein [Polyangiaceae bacterium]HNZ23162.1 AarF/ABC1/UbiB kinase family protein [Polyangiaceae bacterium]HOD22106.1 AarF/ABC1/UbiB kinase family protein [Polyangiaceae bacterium]HOE50896.1 AarF/ABC1/UbiB kinase family protein [Polyangiaceae bacterium]HOH00720.1 AarF/ABC1/UbiB kinase family protein [Polyangiaceae bacterium]